MIYNKITIEIGDRISKIDSIIAQLLQIGLTGVEVINPNDPDFEKKQDFEWDFFDDDILGDTAKLIVYQDITEGNSDIDRSLKEYLENEAFSYTVSVVKSEDWEFEYKKYFKPFKVGRHLVIKPSWEDYNKQDDEIIIELDPGAAFGTGTHETTSMVLEQVENLIKPSDNVIDIGTGSGILAIGASLLGANKVLAIDIDPIAVDTAKENVKKSSLCNIEVELGDLAKDVHEKFDLICINIIAEVIIGMLPDLVKIMKPSTKVILSGIINHRKDDVVWAVKKNGFTVDEIIERGEWYCLVISNLHV